MTLENLNYRTNPMFLRNQFNSSNLYGIPDIPKAEFTDEDFKDLRLLAFLISVCIQRCHMQSRYIILLETVGAERIWLQKE